MIFITQLIYIGELQGIVFHQFENIAIPTILKYNGSRYYDKDQLNTFLKSC